MTVAQHLVVPSETTSSTDSSASSVWASSVTTDTSFGVWTPTSTGTMTVASTVPRGRQHGIWRTAIKTLAVAALPFAAAYDPPSRRLLETAMSHIVVIGEDDFVDDFSVEPESVLTVMPQRTTHWISDHLVPLLPARRPFISVRELFNEDE